MIPTILFLLAFACYTIKELVSFGQFRYYTGIWGAGSWVMKYKKHNTVEGAVKLIQAPDSLYYRLFKIPYKERFPGSATIFVFLTDGFHLMQFLFKLFLFSGIAVLTGDWWHVLGLYLISWMAHHATRFLFKR